MNRHPWGKVPVVMFPDGICLYESRAICKYLARKYSIPLLPQNSDLEAIALFDQAESAETVYFTDAATRVAFEKFAKKLLGLPPNEVAIEEGLRMVGAYFDVAERLLHSNDYMAGDKFTLVDLYYIPLIQRLFTCGYGNIILSRKAVSAWWDRCVTRPAIQKVLADDQKAAATNAAASGAADK